MHVTSASAGHSRATVFTALGLAIALTLLSGALHGRLTQRWHNEQTWQAAVARLQHLPESFGDWQLQETPPLSDSAIELLQCQGYINHVYRHRQSGQQVRVAVMVGPGSRMSIHVPEICYEASNCTLVTPRERIEIPHDGRTDAFWSVRFRLNDVSEQPLHVLYAWRYSEAWLAPRFPRWTVAGAPVLYKLQLSSLEPIGSPVGEAAAAPVTDAVAFLRLFLPLLDAPSTAEEPSGPPAHGG